MKRSNRAYEMALGGMFAALAVAIMTLGGLIPFSTFVCPMICMLILSMVQVKTGKRIAVAWYAAVAILSLLLSPDKEAAAVFLFLGYYPILKPTLERFALRWVLKALLFNAAILLMYWILIHLVGLEQVVQEQQEMGLVMTVVLLLFGNLTFFLLDRALDKFRLRAKKKGTV